MLIGYAGVSIDDQNLDFAYSTNYLIDLETGITVLPKSFSTQ
jgi:hypothetical protein